jgi:hypothetical protein
MVLLADNRISELPQPRGLLPDAHAHALVSIPLQEGVFLSPPGSPTGTGAKSTHDVLRVERISGGVENGPERLGSIFYKYLGSWLACCRILLFFTSAID